MELVTLLAVTDVYGKRLYISQEDFNKGRTQIPLRFSTGRKWSDSPIAKVRRGCTTIHRANIACIEVSL